MADLLLRATYQVLYLSIERAFIIEELRSIQEVSFRLMPNRYLAVSLSSTGAFVRKNSQNWQMSFMQCSRSRSTRNMSAGSMVT